MTNFRAKYKFIIENFEGKRNKLMAPSNHMSTAEKKLFSFPVDAQTEKRNRQCLGSKHLMCVI